MRATPEQLKARRETDDGKRRLAEVMEATRLVPGHRTLATRYIPKRTVARRRNRW